MNYSDHKICIFTLTLPEYWHRPAFNRARTHNFRQQINYPHINELMCRSSSAPLSVLQAEQAQMECSHVWSETNRI